MRTEEKLYEVWELVGDARRLILTVDSLEQAFALVDALQPEAGATTVEITIHVVTDQEGTPQMRLPANGLDVSLDDCERSKPVNSGAYKVVVQKSAGNFVSTTVVSARAALSALATEEAQGNPAWVEDGAGHLISRVELQRLKLRGR